MPSIKDVAQKANVSIGTVSRALRDVGYLSEDIRNRVRKTADELGYVASYKAQQLKSYTPEKTLGIIISESSNAYFFKLIAQLKATLSQHHMRLVVSISSADPKEEEANIRFLISNRVSAIIFIPNSDNNKKLLMLAIKNNIKIIQLFVNVYDNIDTVINDDESGTALATEYLINKGCKHLLLLDAPYKNLNAQAVTPNRTKSFLAAAPEGIETKAVNYDPYPEKDGDGDPLLALIKEYKPDGIIAGIGETGQKVARLLFEKKYEASFVSFDDNDWYESYGITAIKQNTQMVVDSIYQMILTDSEKRRLVLIPEKIIIRNT